jgi:hypothetical protein
VLYLFSGWLRIARYGSKASNVEPILEFFVLFSALFGAYVLLRQTAVSDFWLNIVVLLASVVATRAYRWRRRQYSEARKA